MIPLKQSIKSFLRQIEPLARVTKGLKERRTEFYRFQKRIHPATWANHDLTMRWADNCLSRRSEMETVESYARSTDPTVTQGFELKRRVEAEYRDRHADWNDLRILLYRPDYEQSVGGYSLSGNLAMSLQFQGIQARTISPEQDFRAVLESFQPTVLLTSDNERDLGIIDWGVFDEYRKKHHCALGLTASLEDFGNTPLSGRLAWARARGVGFYYAYSPQEYLHGRADYNPFWDEGYEIFSVEFGANILKYYPIPDMKRDISYVFLGSRNKAKWDRYLTFFDRICREYPGFIHGGGWLKLKDQSVNTDRDRYLYARARVCLNLHTGYEVRWPLECNERSYMLAACGAPMLIDNPAHLSSIFPKDSVFTASTPDEYFELFRSMLANTEEVQRRSLKAQREVIEKYNSFKRAEDFAGNLRRYATGDSRSPTK